MISLTPRNQKTFNCSYFEQHGRFQDFSFKDKLQLHVTAFEKDFNCTQNVGKTH